MADKKIYPRTYAEILAAKLESEGIKVSTDMKKTFQDSFEKVISDIRPDLEISPEFIANGHVAPPDEISVDTTAGKLVAYIEQGGYGPEIGIMHKDKNDYPTDLFLAEVSDANPAVIHNYVYSDPYSENYTESFDIAQRDIDKALNNVEEDLDELN